MTEKQMDEIIEKFMTWPFWILFIPTVLLAGSMMIRAWWWMITQGPK